MKPVTKWWRRMPRSDSEEFNHIEDGHSTADIPSAPQFAGTHPGMWSKDHMWLTDDVPPKLVAYGPDDL